MPCRKEQRFLAEDIAIDEQGIHSRWDDGRWISFLQAIRKASQEFAMRSNEDSLSVASTSGGCESVAEGMEALTTGKDRLAQEEIQHEAHQRASRSDTSRRPFPREFDFQRLVKVSKVGAGCSSVVWRCVDKTTGKDLAMKEISMHTDKNDKQTVLREVLRMYGIGTHHPNLVSCYEVFYAEGCFLVVMELMDRGSLRDHLKRQRNSGREVPGRVMAAVACDVLSSLEFLHGTLGLIHRDVKPGNILISSAGGVKLGDLGICSTVQQVLAMEPPTSSGEGTCEDERWIGTLAYMSPERLVGDRYSQKADVWSLGIVVAEAAMGRFPLSFPGEKCLHFWDLLDFATSGACPSTQIRSDEPAMAEFISKCLSRDASCRPEAHELRGHAWLEEMDREALIEWLE